MKVLWTFHVPISYTFREIIVKVRYGGVWPSRVSLGSGGLIVSNDYASPEMIINMYYFKGFIAVECRQDDPNMTANRNFVHFAHS